MLFTLAFSLSFTSRDALIFAAFSAGIPIATPTGFAVSAFLLAAFLGSHQHLPPFFLPPFFLPYAMSLTRLHGFDSTQHKLNHAVIAQGRQCNDFRQCRDNDPSDRRKQNDFHQALGRPVFMLGRLTGSITTGNGVFLAAVGAP